MCVSKYQKKKEEGKKSKKLWTDAIEDGDKEHVEMKDGIVE